MSWSSPVHNLGIRRVLLALHPQNSSTSHNKRTGTGSDSSHPYSAILHQQAHRHAECAQLLRWARFQRSCYPPQNRHPSRCRSSRTIRGFTLCQTYTNLKTQQRLGIVAAIWRPGGAMPDRPRNTGVTLREQSSDRVRRSAFRTCSSSSIISGGTDTENVAVVLFIAEFCSIH